MEFDNLARQPSVEWIGQAPREALQRGSRPLDPDHDRFYQPPPGFQHALPGTVLRSREVELAFLGLIPQPLTATQLLYRTSRRDGSPAVTATTVLTPADRDSATPCPVLSYQCAIDAASRRCFPSYALRRRARATGSFAQLEFVLIAAALAEGWAVSIPDHEGPDGLWGAPYEPGYCVLDGVRAALGDEQLALGAKTPVALWGYSGGGLATGWAAEVYADYAPELNIVGAVLGSPVGDLGHTFRRLNGTFFSGLPAVMIAALAHSYPDLDQVIEDHATDEGLAMLRGLESVTTAGAVIRMRNKTLADYIDQPLEDILALPAVQHVFEDTKLGTAVPTLPVLMVQSVHDQVISVEHIDHLADVYEAGGARLTYYRDAFSDHIVLHPLSTPMVLQWLRARFAGRPVADRPVRRTRSVLLSPTTYLGMAHLGVIVAKVITGGLFSRRSR